MQPVLSSSFHDLPYEEHPVPGASLDDLSRMHFGQYLRKAFHERVLGRDKRTWEGQMAVLRMVVRHDGRFVPTVLGVLTIGRSPRRLLPCAYVQFLKVEGEEMSDGVFESLETDGPVADIVGRLDEKFQECNQDAAEVGPAGKGVEPYPMKALQELTRNAIIHRAYEGTDAPIGVHWYSNRVEIISPGGPYGKVRGRLGEPGYAEFRNPGLADFMKRMGLAQRYGLGIHWSRRILKKGRHQLLGLYEDDYSVRVTVYPSRAYMRQGG